MKIVPELTDSTVLEALGSRLKTHRLRARLTQAELAEQAGVGKRTLERLEAGEGSELGTLVRVLRTLGLIEGFDRLLPEVGPGPIARLEAQGRQPQRVGHPRSRGTPAEDDEPWQWGED